MNQKTILGLAAILALTIMVVAGFYFTTKQPSVEGEKVSQPNKVIQESAASEIHPEISTGVEQDAVQGIKEDKQSQPQVLSPQAQPELVNFEYDSSLDSVGLLLSMEAYDELPAFEQKALRQFQQYIFDKTAKDTGKSKQDFSLQESGALETEGEHHRIYIYKFHTGTDCEVHEADIDTETGKYSVRYNYC